MQWWDRRFCCRGRIYAAHPVRGMWVAYMRPLHSPWQSGIPSPPPTRVFQQPLDRGYKKAMRPAGQRGLCFFLPPCQGGVGGVVSCGSKWGRGGSRTAPTVHPDIGQARGPVPTPSPHQILLPLIALRSPPLRITLSSGEAAYRRVKSAPTGEMRHPSFDTAHARLLRMRSRRWPYKTRIWPDR